MGNLKLDINERLYNNTSESFLCDVCEERFENLNGLKIHMTNKHGKDSNIDNIVKDEGMVKTEVDDENTLHENDNNEMKQQIDQELDTMVENEDSSHN